MEDIVDDAHDMGIGTKPTFMKFSLTELSDVFVRQISIQFHNMRMELRRFSVLNCLSDDEIAYLATAEKSQAKMLDYLPNETVVPEGYKNMDHFYLVVQGSVKAERSLLIQRQQTGQSQKVTPMSMGETTARDYFGLREMLHHENQLKAGETKRFLPAQAQYAAKYPDLTTKLIKITYEDFKKVMPKSAVKRLAELFEGDEVSATGAEAELQIEKKHTHFADASESSSPQRMDLVLKKAQTIVLPQKSPVRR